MIDEDHLAESGQNIEQEDLFFEISFCKGILKRNPNFMRALILLGDLYTRSGQYPEGLVIDLKLQELSPDDPYILYNLSCSYSLLKQCDKAFLAIQQAIACGYQDFEFLEKDKDLMYLRNDVRFQEYYEKLKNQMCHE
ncbi:MAG: hypothetical protein K8S27_04860 [Candidatus Omnitrophica bacterium]|nr:hypothetical protein [Candidatus Omnitrophota bacterium]